MFIFSFLAADCYTQKISDCSKNVFPLRRLLSSQLPPSARTPMSSSQ